MNMIKKTGGFTLVELIVVIAIIAILAGVAVPAYSGYIKSANDAAVETELTALSTAAMAANATVGQLSEISVGTDGKSVTIKGATAKDFATDFKTFYGVDATASATSGEYSVTITPSSAWAGSNWADKGAKWTPSAGWELAS